MIIGIGIDLVDSSRFENWTDENFSRVFTKKEIDIAKTYENPISKFAKIWAVKEAVVKAIGVGFADGVSFKDVELDSEKSQAPIVQVYGRVLEIIKEKSENFNIHCSISDDANLSVAMIIIEKK